MGFSKEKKHSDFERWICIYPAYINNKKSRAAGRRVPLSKAADTPTFEEIRDVVSAAGLRVAVEDKTYSRENSRELPFRGRVRVQLRTDSGAPVLPQFPSRDALLLHLGDSIPRLKSRQNRPTTEAGASGSAVAALSGGTQTAAGAPNRRKAGGKRH